MHTLHCIGLSCPGPVMHCRDLLEKQAVSQCTVLVDNKAAAENVHRFLEQRGFTVVSTFSDGQFTLQATRLVNVQPSMEYCKPSAANASASSKALVFITTQTLGRGNDNLGHKLMAAFLSTLPEMGESLWRIILLNGGVWLSAQSGAALDALQSLETSGVDILVCGTCLAHYGLSERKAVGESSNMLDIVTSLALADKVIRP